MSRTRPNNARLLLSRGMTRHERQLNSRLIETLLRGFAAWRRQLPPPPGQAMRAAGRSSGKSEQLETNGLWGTPGQTGRAGEPAAKQGEATQARHLERRLPENLDARELLDYLMLRVQDELDSLQWLAVRHAEFNQAMSQASTVRDQQQLVLVYARDLGTAGRGGWGDQRAQKRWFSEQAVVDRYRRQQGEAEQRLTFTLQRLGSVIEHVVGLVGSQYCPKFWERLRLERLIQGVLGYDGDVRVHVAAVRCLRQPLQAMPRQAVTGLLSARNLSHLQQTAGDHTRDVWLQCETLSLLTVVAEDRGMQQITERLAKPQGGDDLFVRAHCVALLQTLLTDSSDWDRWPTELTQDSSQYVRQRVARALWQAPAHIAVPGLRQLALHDDSPQVRAATLVEALQRVDRRDLQLDLLQMLEQILGGEQNEFVLRTAMHVAATLRQLWQHQRSASTDSDVSQVNPSEVPEEDPFYRERIVPRLRELQANAAATPVRRWAAECAERIWVLSHPVAGVLYERLQSRCRDLQHGSRCRLPRRWFRRLDRDLVGRTLSVLAQDDFGYDLESGWWSYRLVKQPVFGLRLWRAWYEFWRPATDKRQAFRHTIGRVSAAGIRAPSRILSELSQTKVPGEPLQIASDGTWRSFLPLPDDFVSLLNRSFLWTRTARFYSSEGVTDVKAPRSFLRCVWAAMRLTIQFPAYAMARNWEETSPVNPRKYVQAMQQIGFRVRFRPYLDEQGRPVAEDASVHRFFPCALAVLSPSTMPWLWSFLRDYAYYFGSAFENSLAHLVLFTAAFLVFFLGKHAYANFRIRRARRAIPLSLGGWGTRGKSGTERLKAALLVTLGHGLISKTTGCEAMFIQAHAFGEPLEIPLFRPYDKATIWEQANLLRLAAGLQPSVFLWECMGLTPAYVDVLQRQWTQDDLATITNTYPDHEDLQGPAGFNVATTIAGFVPRHSRVITTEQTMRPVLQASCDRVGTTLRGVGWLESGLIPDDILDRFPYQEHPDNIALVAAMADELGCPCDVALKGMADYLVPDLGVLKTFPEAHIRTRRIEFTNGMSANERFGALGNWKRVGYDQQDPYEQVDVWVSTVVNNRADRVARSRVFAAMLVNDLEADRHFVIGSNLKGLVGFIWEAWQQYQQELSLLTDKGEWDASAALQTLVRMARRFRQPSNVQHVQDALRRMLQAVCPADDSEICETLVQQAWNQPTQLAARLAELQVDASLVSDVVRQQERLVQALREFEELAATIRQTSQTAQVAPVNDRFRQQLRSWFERKLVVIENYDASGEEIIRQLVQETPPGYRNRVMGVQNIKGTGLDFVYRFQAWGSCHQACELLNDPDGLRLRKGLQVLTELPALGQLCQAKVQESLQQLQRSPAAQSPEIQTQLEIIQQKLDQNLLQLEQPATDQRGDTPQRSGWLPAILRTVEQFLDVQDALCRRQQADQIYRDLRAERIGRQQAVEQIRTLNKRQKGGWLRMASSPRGHTT